MTRQELISECKRRHEAGEGIKELISFLRNHGCSKIDSIAVIAVGCGIGLAKAKEAVHFSSTWDDTRIADEKFHGVIADALSTKHE